MVSYLPPYQYSRYNTPSKFILHDDIERWTKKTTEGVGHGKSQNLDVNFNILYEK